jgi:hypothetical protein
VHAQAQTSKLSNQRSRSTQDGASLVVADLSRNDDVASAKGWVEATRNTRDRNHRRGEFLKTWKPPRDPCRSHAAAFESSVWHGARECT